MNGTHGQQKAVDDGNGTVDQPVRAELRTPRHWCAICRLAFPSSYHLRRHAIDEHGALKDGK